MLKTTGDSLSIRQWEMLVALQMTAGNVLQACELSGVASSTHYYWVDESPEYRTALRLVERETVARLEAEADRRAIEGVARLKFHQGQALIDPRTGKPYEEREYSDTLLALRLKALDPEKYRDRHEHRIGPIDDEALKRRALEIAERIRAGRTPATDGADGEGSGQSGSDQTPTASEAERVPGP